jgi:hypothetical protein
LLLLKQIEEGINVETCRAGLRKVEENTPEAPPYVNYSISVPKKILLIKIIIVGLIRSFQRT